MKVKNIVISVSVISFLFAISCGKSEIENPYDGYTTPKLYEKSILANLPTSNFGYLHQSVFKPTCANSGCHDGAFEPDFRTISSSYNNTVFHNVLTNDASNSFIYRIKPGDAVKSLLHERLLVSLPSTSGIMPPVYADEWIVNKENHIKAIKDWINAGAKDMYGNTPVQGNPNPIVEGFHVFANGSSTSPFPRAGGSGILPIIIPRTNVDLWFSINDETTPSTNLTVNEIKISYDMFGFDTVPASNMTIPSSSITAQDFTNTNATFTHKFDFDASGYPANTILYVRVYVQDANHTEPGETPGDGSSKGAILLFTLYTT